MDRRLFFKSAVPAIAASTGVPALMQLDPLIQFVRDQKNLSENDLVREQARQALAQGYSPVIYYTIEHGPWLDETGRKTYGHILTRNVLH